MKSKKRQLIIEHKLASVVISDRTSQTCLKHMVNQQLSTVSNYCDYYNYYIYTCFQDLVTLVFSVRKIKFGLFSVFVPFHGFLFEH